MAKWKAPQKAKRDANEQEIFDTLLRHGFEVEPTDKPADALATRSGVNYIVEVKSGPKAPLRPYQVDFINRWSGQYVILCSIEDATAWAKYVRGGSVGLFHGEYTYPKIKAEALEACGIEVKESK